MKRSIIVTVISLVILQAGEFQRIRYPCSRWIQRNADCFCLVYYRYTHRDIWLSINTWVIQWQHYYSAVTYSLHILQLETRIVLNLMWVVFAFGKYMLHCIALLQRKQTLVFKCIKTICTFFLVLFCILHWQSLFNVGTDHPNCEYKVLL